MPVLWMICPRCWGTRLDALASGACAGCDGTGRVADEQLSPHFRLSEMVQSETAARRLLANLPTREQRENLWRLCAEVLEPVRAQFGALRVTSGFRSAPVNAAIGGSRTSAHRDGHAADLQPMAPDVALRDIVLWVRDHGPAVDQVIFEAGSWVHVGRIGPSGVVRRQTLAMWPGESGPAYSLFDPDDPRILQRTA